MTVKAQYNPSTSKASFNPATGKAQAVQGPVICDNCDNPAQITVAISGLEACCAKQIPDVVGFRNKFASAFMDFMNDTHTLNSTATPCEYVKTYLLEEPDWEEQGGNPPGDCSTFTSTVEAYNFTVRVNVASTNLVVSISWQRVAIQGFTELQRWTSPLADPCYSQTLGTSTAIIDDCDDPALWSSAITALVKNGTCVVARVP